MIKEGFFELRSEGCEEGRMKFSESALAERKQALPIWGSGRGPVWQECEWWEEWLAMKLDWLVAVGQSTVPRPLRGFKFTGMVNQI